MFKLDKRLEKDTLFIKELKNFQIRLMNTVEFFWIVFIPNRPNLIELNDLNINERNYLMNFAIDLGQFIKYSKKYDKVNIGMIGNVVSQLHLHLVLRNKDDIAWPETVWGWKHMISVDENIFILRKKIIENFVNDYKPYNSYI